MTVGISPKARLAALIPAFGSVVAILIQWAITGEYDRSELVTTVTGLSASLLAFLGAWLGSPGVVVADQGPSSDELLGDAPLSDAPIAPDED